MNKKEEFAEQWKVAQGKVNMYLIHKLLWEIKALGISDVDTWKDLKELFQSTDYNLQMELRPIEFVWGDTSEIDKLLNKMTGGGNGKTKDTG